MRPCFFALAWFIVAMTPALPLFDPYTSRYSAAYSSGFSPLPISGRKWLLSALVGAGFVAIDVFGSGAATVVAASGDRLRF